MTTNRHQNLVNWARQYMYNKSNVYQGVDNKLEDQYHREGAVIVSNLVSRCVSHEPKSRPRMAEVLEPSYVMRESLNTPERTLTLGRGNHLLSFFFISRRSHGTPRACECISIRWTNILWHTNLIRGFSDVWTTPKFCSIWFIIFIFKISSALVDLKLKFGTLVYLKFVWHFNSSRICVYKPSSIWNSTVIFASR